MLLVLAAVLGTLGGLWHGGALRHFARLSFRWPLLFLGGLILRAVAFSPLVAHGGAAIALYVVALALLVVGMAANRRIVGIELVLLGLVLNAAVILANGGAMPVTADALRLIGQYDFALQLRDLGPTGHVELATPDTRLRGLADIIPLSPLPFFGLVVSVGDLLIAAGVLVIFYFGTLRGESANESSVVSHPAPPAALPLAPPAPLIVSPAATGSVVPAQQPAADLAHDSRLTTHDPPLTTDD